MRFTAPLLVVYKKTGGRLWNKPWGLPPLTKTQIRNRKKENNIVQQTLTALRLAAANEPPKQSNSKQPDVQKPQA